MSAFTVRQAKAWDNDVIPVLERHGIPRLPTSHGWTLTWADEVRPGRGHSLDATFCDGEQYAQVLMDVYGYPNISIALLTWVHADSDDDELACEDCDEGEPS
ncbi:hypothetical protein GCM10011584_09590 [Nocardioides phosphati]|uniref:Uncharacterized protein n=1 Tax=Nocardioides phosphati TaxID=1867775 RepID=A0ABQ2N9H5_9ACTN|nr:hypothetical protein [Nocardioides phosphati]GGO86685.1 hypothetical protein GCM10011584_09590 [Nocardioides phosphati]